MVKLFGETLNYEIYPKYDIMDHIKQRWTQTEIMDLLKKQANDLEDNVFEYDKNDNINNGYDGLIVIISCHGIKNYIISSDYYKIDKTALHRQFSFNHPKSRNIPRLFVFDCCDGRSRERSRLESRFSRRG